ncbi:nuclear transport factor 2 family protein [Streptomyces barringtoniae]|uniref:nuclear transport factor 2 family protein n=1 Tax=Streptomyces barringtoniae TaxID=2892029 RepID=UPI001E3E4EAA|nr:nuclear transport factor 2 family protein [Streptomyces barringtoniae]MCC5481257.1 nuclear transport factor 2 family protein [Streptomyces barringtoniae]
MTVELVGTAEGTLHSRKFAALYAQVQQFYAHQMQILDAHDTDSWSGTFTEDAVLELPSLSEPVRARDGLARYVRAGAARQRRAGSRLDHWVGKLDVHPRADGSLQTRCSALVYLTPSGGGSKVLCAYVMEDVLVRTRGEWRAAHRRVTRDDLA